MIKTTTKTTVLVVVLLIMTVIPAWASQGIGSGPYTADLLVSGLNTGKLNPGQEYWYAYSRLDLGDPAYNSIILSLNFEAEGRAVASRVNFQVFTFEQVDAWLKDNSGPIDSLGLGTPASADFDVNTGERLWAGAIKPTEIYYVRIFNVSPSPVHFRLTALGQKSAQLEGIEALTSSKANDQTVIPVALNEGSNTTSAPDIAAAPAPPVRQTSIAESLPGQPDDGSPASTGWLLAAQAINGLPPHEAAAWLMSAATLGWLPLGGGSEAAVPVNPNPNAPLVSSGDGDAGTGGGAAVPVEPDPNKGESIYPNQPLRLLMGRNTGRMGPHTEYWYTFTPGKVDGKLIEDFSLTMFYTPGEPNQGKHVNFELFTGSQYHIWERGTPQDMEHFGAGAWVSRDNDYDTGERLWHGSVVDGDQYFVKVTNASDQWVDYHLITDDIINIEMGPQPTYFNLIAPAIVKAPTGQDIGSPLAIMKGHTKGQLKAGEDIWYRFENVSPNPDKFEFQNHVIKLEHTPGAGHVANYVNFEIYPYQEQQIWMRGDTDKIRPLGAGSDLNYNKETDIHTWIWDGHFVTNTVYFIRVRNDSPFDIDYDLSIQQRR
jgi:hypothetical protein